MNNQSFLEKRFHFEVFRDEGMHVFSVSLRLLDADTNPLHVHQLSGHKRVESLQRYHVASLKQQKKMSEILSDANINLPSCSSSSASSFNNPSDVPKKSSQKKYKINFLMNGILYYHHLLREQSFPTALSILTFIIRLHQNMPRNIIAFYSSTKRTNKY